MTDGRPSRAEPPRPPDDHEGDGSHPDEDDWVPPPIADTPMWLSHHWASEYDRCVRIGGRHVCRRCLVLYPMAAACAVLVRAGVTWPHRYDAWVCWLLPLPAVVEFCGEHLGVLRYHFRRQVAVTVLLAVACGALYSRYLDHTRDALTWGVVTVYGGICIVAALLRAFNPPGDRV